MRRLFVAVALFALTGTLVAQTPQPMPLTQPDRFHSTVRWTSRQQQGENMRLQGARFEFENGVTITADEALIDKARNAVRFFGTVQMTVK